MPNCCHFFCWVAQRYQLNICMGQEHPCLPIGISNKMVFTLTILGKYSCSLYKWHRHNSKLTTDYTSLQPDYSKALHRCVWNVQFSNEIHLISLCSVTDYRFWGVHVFELLIKAFTRVLPFAPLTALFGVVDSNSVKCRCEAQAL